MVPIFRHGPLNCYSNNAFAEFSNIWETAFNVLDTGLLDNFDCNVNRTKGDPTQTMYLINHFLDKLVLGQEAPDTDKLNQTNAASGAGSLGAQVSTCIITQGRPPNFMLVDVCCHIYSCRNHLTCRPSSFMNLVMDLYSRWQQTSTGFLTPPLLLLRPLLPHLSPERH